MTKPLIGISADQKPIADDVPIIHISSSVNFADGVKAAGGLPIYLPISDNETAKAFVNHIDGLLLTGGQDVHPKYYGQEVLTDKDDYDMDRDRFELALIDETIKQGKPILAVCRGMQLLNVYLGGTLNQEILNHSQGMPIGTYHTVDVAENSHLAQLIPSGTAVNSVHHQSIDTLGQGLVVTARDPRDGVIEALELLDYPLVAVQWHPEFLIDQAPHQALFSGLVKKAKQDYEQFPVK